MKCEACEQAQATVHLTEIVNKKKREMHLCEACARQKGVTVKAAFAEPDEKAEAEKPKAPPVVAGTHAVEKAPPTAIQRVDDLAGTSCPVCGLTFAEFRASGRLGCANDYLAFKRGLVPLLEKIHDSVEHRGKVPLHVGARLERQRRLQELRESLRAEIARENYERCREIRDEILTLEEKART